MENLGLKKLKKKVTFNETVAIQNKTENIPPQSESPGSFATNVKKLEDVQVCVQ